MVNVFSKIQQSHAQLNSFFPGKQEYIAANARTFPLLWIDLKDVEIMDTYSDYTWHVAVYDRLITSGEGIQSPNEWDVISTANQILKDITILLRDNYSIWVNFGKAEAAPLVEFSGDNLAGMMLDITMEIGETRGICDIPLLSSIPSNDMLFMIDSNNFNVSDSNGSLIISQ